MIQLSFRGARKDSWEKKIMNNTTKNRISEKVKEIFAEANENPGKFARLILSKDRSAFIRNDGKRFRIQKAVIATQKGNQPMSIIRFSMQKSDLTLLSVMIGGRHFTPVRRNLYEITYA